MWGTVVVFRTRVGHGECPKVKKLDFSLKFKFSSSKIFAFLNPSSLPARPVIVLSSSFSNVWRHVFYRSIQQSQSQRMEQQLEDGVRLYLERRQQLDHKRRTRHCGVPGRNT